MSNGKATMRVRRPGLGQLCSDVRFSRWRDGLTAPRRLVAVAGAAWALVLTLVGVAAAGVFPGSGTAAGPAAHHASRPARAVRAARGPGPATAAPLRARTAAHVRAGPLRTSCRSVAHIGDSTSVGLISPADLPDPAQRLAARYARVGVRQLRVDASGGRSIVEVLPGQVNGYDVARGWQAGGYRGCWVFALGTNDTANVAVGSAVGRMARIGRMMSAAHGQPVLWVNARTLLSGGPWAESDMRIWNDALRRACATYPNLRVFDWAWLANAGWYISDGIHYTSAGYAARAKAIAGALARAFPHGRAGRHSCVVR
jgi:lysophospholipase L1-like esterase